MKNATRAIILGLLAMTGCAPDEQSLSPIVGRGNLDFPSLPTNAVLVTVNGRALTKAEMERLADLQATLAGVANPDLKADAIERLKTQLMPTLQRQFLSQTLFLQAAEQARVVPTADDMKLVEDEAVVALDGELLSGSLPPKQLRILDGFLALHEEETYAAWNLAVQGKQFARIQVGL